MTAVYEAGLSERVSVSALQGEPIAACHFLLRDDAAFRVEVDRHKAKALVNFNDEDFGSTLKDVFEWLVEERSALVSTPV